MDTYTDKVPKTTEMMLILDWYSRHEKTMMNYFDKKQIETDHLRNKLNRAKDEIEMLAQSNEMMTWQIDEMTSDMEGLNRRLSNQIAEKQKIVGEHMEALQTIQELTQALNTARRMNQRLRQMASSKRRWPQSFVNLTCVESSDSDNT